MQIVKGGALEDCIINLQLFSESTYLKSLSQQVRELLHGQPNTNMIGLEPPNNDLTPSHSVIRLLSILKEILSVASMVESRQADITKIVSCVIDPLLHSITESASHLPTVDMAVYILNCLYQMQSTLGMFEYVDSRMERLQAQCDAQIDTLTSEQASSLVANLNLGPIYTLLQSSSKDVDPNHLKMFTVTFHCVALLQQILNAFIFQVKLDSFLEMPDVLLLPQVNLLQSNAHRSAVQKRSFNVIVAIYKQIYGWFFFSFPFEIFVENHCLLNRLTDRVHDPSNNLETQRAILNKTPDQLSESLSV